MHTALELAEAFIQAGELDDALAALDEHLAEYPDDSDVRRLRIDVLLRLPGRARAALDDLGLLPDDPLLRYQIFERLGDHAAAFAAVEQAWDQAPDPRTAELLLRLLEQRREVEKALRVLADLPKTSNWLEWSGDFHALKGDCPAAVEYFCAALDLLADSNDPLIRIRCAHLLLKRAESYRKMKSWAQAEADYRAAETIIPDDPLILFNRGLLIYEQGHLRQALPLCRDALDHAPEGLRAHMRAVLTDEPRYRTLAQALLG